MTAKQHTTPPLHRYLEPHLRAIVKRWKLEVFFSGACGEEYVAWVRGEATSLEHLYGEPPTPQQLCRAVAAAIVDEDGLTSYMSSRNGGAEVLEDENKLANLAKAAAGIVVALYEDGAQMGAGLRGT
jgi:hypothetical protein